VKLLLVEDEARIATFLERGLRAAGFTVDWVSTGGEALERMHRGDDPAADVVLLDLGLPDVDGLEVLAALRASGFGTRVVVVTARCESADRSRAAELGVDGYLIKPFSIADLLASLPRTSRGVEVTGNGRSPPTAASSRTAS
jgi:DNA-binding response OmpR family regulator